MTPVPTEVVSAIPLSPDIQAAIAIGFFFLCVFVGRILLEGANSDGGGKKKGK